MLTKEEIRELSAAGKDWPAIPPSCPEGVRRKICEFRKGILNGTIRQTKATKALHTAAVKAVNEGEKLRLRLIAVGIE